LLAAPNLAALSDTLDRARLHQAKVTTALRVQAREAITGFINALPDRGGLAATTLWHDALILIYRLLFVLKLESAAGFSFAASDLWRGAFSPNQALGPLVRRHLDQGHETGRMLQDGLRRLFTLFRDGTRASALSVAALGGGLFGAATMPHLDRVDWGERAAAILLDRLIWLPGTPRARVHYGSLGVEDLGSIYEALLEQEPDFAADGSFTLRTGPGRKSSGAYYTPRDFVRFLVRETLDPLIAAHSPPRDPNPAALLRLKLVDPATGSGHFLVEACRHLSEAVLTAARQADTLGLTDRLAAIPDPDATLVPYLPSRGDNETVARAICRRLVAVHCLYGCDRNKLAVELAKLSLWLESWAEGLPLTFLDHRIVHGDALTGPFFAHLTTLPVTGGPLDPLLARDVTACLHERMAAARTLVSELDASIGRDLADLADKEAAKQRLDALLDPLRHLAHAWTEAAMTGARDGDDCWIALAREVLASANTSSWPGSTGPSPGTVGTTRTSIRASRHGDGPVKPGHDGNVGPGHDGGVGPGHDGSVGPAHDGNVGPGHDGSVGPGHDGGVGPGHDGGVGPGHDGNVGPAHDAGFEPADHAGDHQRPADTHPIPWDLTFPDVFPTGFAAVLGNPPWDVVLPNSVDFLTDIDPSIRQAPTRQARAVIQRRALADPTVAARFDAYRAGFERLKRITPRLYPLQRAASGSLDLYRLFAERALSLASADGTIGLVLPSAFHANAGAAGLRRHYLDATRIDWCLSFENRRRWFDIDSRFKFDLIVARRPGPTRTLRCGFYLEHLGQAGVPGRIMTYGRRFLDAAGGSHLTPPELRGEADLRVAERLYANPTRLAAWCAERRIRFGCDLHMTADSALFRPAGEGEMVLHEGKTFHQFTPTWDTAPRYSVDAAALRPALVEAARHTRLVFRDIARSNNERTMIACLAPPGSVFGHTATVEQAPWLRKSRDAALLCAVFNSFPFDWLIRQKAATHLSLYLLNDLPMPRFTPAQEALLARNAHRPPPPATRARMDAVVAQAYGLDRALYARVLAGFSHRSWPEAPAACLAAFDAMETSAMETSCPAA
jgi:N-6 DNA Methylase